MHPYQKVVSEVVFLSISVRRIFISSRQGYIYLSFFIKRFYSEGLKKIQILVKVMRT